MSKPTIQPICWGDSFLMRKNVNVLKTGTIYEIIGMGGKKGMKCWNIKGVGLVPITTITELFNRNILYKKL